MRGKQLTLKSLESMKGITPAHAGKTLEFEGYVGQE